MRPCGLGRRVRADNRCYGEEAPLITGCLPIAPRQRPFIPQAPRVLLDRNPGSRRSLYCPQSWRLEWPSERRAGKQIRCSFGYERQRPLERCPRDDPNDQRMLSGSALGGCCIQLYDPNDVVESLVPHAGLEPARPCGQQILSLPRLPFRQWGTRAMSRTRRDRPAHHREAKQRVNCRSLGSLRCAPAGTGE
jgi:hypothetical protein